METLRPSPFQPSDLKPSFSPAKSRFQDTCKTQGRRNAELTEMWPTRLRHISLS